MKQISSKQFVITVFLLTMAQKIFLLPALLIKTAGRDSWLSVLIFLAVEAAVLAVLILTMKAREGRSFYQLLDEGATKAGGRVIAVIMLFYLFLKAMLLMSEIRVFFNVTVSESLSPFMAFLPLCFWLFFIGTKTLRGMGRLAEILIPFILIAILIILCLVAGNNVGLGQLKPVLSAGIRPVLSNVFYYPMWFGDLSVMVVFLGQVKSGKHFAKASFIAFILSGAATLFFTAMLFASYGQIPSLMDYSNNVSNMLLHSSSSYIYGRFDIPVFCVWIMSAFVQLGIVFYSMTRHAVYVTGLKSNRLISFFFAAAVYLVFVLAFRNEHSLFYFSTRLAPRLFWVFNALIVPLFLLVTALITRRRKNRKDRPAPIKSVSAEFISAKPVSERGLKIRRKRLNNDEA